MKKKKETVKKQNNKFDFNKLKNSKLIDVLLVVIAISLLLFIHNYAVSGPPGANHEYYVNEEGLPHLFDMDSYYYARKTREFINGTETKIITTRSQDDLQTNLSDRDDSRYTLLLSKIVSIIYKIVNLFKHVSFYKVIIYSSGMLSTLVAIPTYIFIKRRTNRLGGFFSAILAGTSVAYFSHWAYGCFDTDVLLYTIPAMYICSFIETLVEKDNKKRIMWILISSMAFVLLMCTWDVFGVYYFLTVGSAILLLIISLFKEKFKLKNIIKLPEVKYSFFCVIIYTILSLIVTKGIDISILRDILSVLKPKEFSNMSYPNPGEYTSELMKLEFISFKNGANPFEASSGYLVNRLGGLFIVLVSFAGLLVLGYKTYKHFKNKDESLKSESIVAIILIVWAIGGLLSTRMGVRFVKMAVIPVNFIAAYAIGYFYNVVKVKRLGFSFIFLSLALLITPCLGAQDIANTMPHSANDALVETANYIKQNTKEDAVVVSWWDYGYFFEYQSERRALADGGTYNGRFIYYLAKSLTTDSELVSTNIMKMLSKSGTTVSYVAEEYFNTPTKANEVLDKVFNTKTKEEANKLLMNEYNLTEEQANNITKYTHPEIDYEIILVLTNSMLKMKGAINYYGNYDFEKGVASVTQLDVNSTYLVLYDKDEDTKYFEHMLRNTDVTDKLSTNIFRIK